MAGQRMREATRAVAGVGIAALMVMVNVSPAAATDDFGHHVRTCAQTMGFSGDHNPGMHQGHAGWSADHSC